MKLRPRRPVGPFDQVVVEGLPSQVDARALEQDGWHACSPEVRARDLQAAFADPEIDALQTMRGGYGSAQVIPLLDFDAIAETPKAFVGLSDITALHAALEGQTPSLTAQGRLPNITCTRSTVGLASSVRGYWRYVSARWWLAGAFEARGAVRAVASGATAPSGRAGRTRTVDLAGRSAGRCDRPAPYAGD
jgi:LD-carboxypeptidase N-terminal domain